MVKLEKELADKLAKLDEHLLSKANDLAEGANDLRSQLTAPTSDPKV